MLQKAIGSILWGHFHQLQIYIHFISDQFRGIQIYIGFTSSPLSSTPNMYQFQVCSPSFFMKIQSVSTCWLHICTDEDKMQHHTKLWAILNNDDDVTSIEDCVIWWPSAQVIVSVLIMLQLTVTVAPGQPAPGGILYIDKSKYQRKKLRNQYFVYW